MKEFKFEIIETLQKNIIVNAENEEDAYRMINDMYHNEKIVLSSEDYIDTEINLIN